MKNLVKLTLLAALLLCSSTTYAQKFGYVNSQELITAMPERDSALSKYQKFAQDQQSQLETIQVEFNNKYLDYQKNAETLSESAKQLKERELQDLQKRFDDFQQVAEQDAQKMQQQLMGPVITKAQDAIKKVAQAAGYTIVFDVAAGAMAYYNEATVTNILPLVKRNSALWTNLQLRNNQIAVRNKRQARRPAFLFIDCLEGNVLGAV
ncbi:MAG: OmpH family outer membrane protein [Alistipes indistinctus]